MSQNLVRPALLSGRGWLKVLLSLLMIFTPAASAQDEKPATAGRAGHVDVFIFQDGLPQAHVPFSIDGRKFETNSEGGLYLTLPAARYEIQIGPDKRFFRIEAGVVTRIIINDAGKDSEISIDEPPPVQGTTSSEVSAATGAVAGVVVSSEEGGHAIEGAKVYAGGSADTAVSDAAGRFVLKLPAGRYTVSVIHRNYASFSTAEIEIKSGETQEIKAELAPLAKVSLREIVVTAPQLAGSLSALIQERKMSANVTDVLASEQISKSGDSDAGAALRRSTGLTLIDGKYVYVRGLGERYSSTLLNGSVLPSPHPARRVVPLDLFPASILEGITIQKTYTPDMPGEFGGGVILLKTKSLPEKPFFSIGASLSHVQGVTGEQGLSHRGGKQDWTGFDDGTRALPDSIRTRASGRKVEAVNPANPNGFSAEEIRAMGAGFSPRYNTSREKVPFGRGVNVSFGSRFSLFPSVQAGIAASSIYGQDFSAEERVRTRYNVANSETGEMVLDTKSNIASTRSEVKLSSKLFTGLKFGRNAELKNTALLVRKTEDYTQVEDQFIHPNNPNLKTTLSWQERQLFTNQTAYEHVFPGLNKLSLGLRHTFAQALLYSPDRRRYQYNRQQDGVPVLSESPVRLFGDLTENGWDDAVDFKLPLSLGEEKRVTLMAGGQITSRERQASVRRFSFGNATEADRALSPDEIYDAQSFLDGTYTLQESTIATDNYTAQQQVRAVYGAFDLEMWGWFRFYSGLRYERSEQEVRTFELHNPDAKPIISDLTTVHTLPVFSLTFGLAKDMQLRLSRSKTISRPDFKELSQAEYYDDDNSISVRGNEDLRATAITSHDARWEYYLKDKQNVSVGVFHKEFDKPIELFVEYGAVDDLYSFSNAKSAYVQGVEIDFRVNFHQGNHWLRNYYFAGNRTNIWSEVDLGDSGAAQTSKKRPLQGQSSYVNNYTLGYDDADTKTTISLLYNVFGERIREVGTKGAPDIKEKPFDQFDLVALKTFGSGLRSGLKVRNLFPKDSIFKQGTLDSQVRKTYRSYSVDATYTF